MFSISLLRVSLAIANDASCTEIVLLYIIREAYICCFLELADYQLSGCGQRSKATNVVTLSTSSLVADVNAWKLWYNEVSVLYLRTC